jgi:ADP-heptose:LPS heptosyltransferase
VNCAGGYSILQSASILKQSEKLITGDTGLMHIASFFEIHIVSIWGNTTPKFGMYPYRNTTNPNDVIIEKSDLNCRPCSKIGYDQCPKGHFKCMAHEPTEIIKFLG